MFRGKSSRSTIRMNIFCDVPIISSRKRSHRTEGTNDRGDVPPRSIDLDAIVRRAPCDREPERGSARRKENRTQRIKRVQAFVVQAFIVPAFELAGMR